MDNNDYLKAIADFTETNSKDWSPLYMDNDYTRLYHKPSGTAYKLIETSPASEYNSFQFQRIGEDLNSLIVQDDLIEYYKCDRCNCSGEDDHSCPYNVDINDDYSTLCNCCDNCRSECAMDI